MTPEQINIGIAEHCGFTSIRMICGMIYGLRCGELMAIPNYHGDLNAYTEAHKSLNRHQRRCYLAHIMHATGIYPWAKTLDNAATRLAFVNLMNASAAQRAEAFLRTIGKWKEPAQL